MHKEIAGIVAVLALAGCSATTSSGTAARAPTGGVAPQNVMQAFVDGVNSYCIHNVLNGDSMRDIEAEFDTISRLSAVTNPMRLRMATTGGPAYTLDTSGDIVMVDGDGEICRVSGYGPSARATTGLVADIVTEAWNATELENPSDPGPLVFDRMLVIEQDGKRVRVFVSGNEPGAPGTRSRFSTLMATVRRVELDASS